ncbi:uncharacterized protein TrAFT101_009753 [Trichoderma asperellum]|uniref:Uncharacterized protein n=1 Tax=Trichoderma asperellum (strain ATCC 204424 / CBS 433.97 / NBRC 101777) TaxID=1042311 RepID=A0A2T3Z9Z5_TRIA4|nr:hypothetical protein M441DRAFT_36946 [Trichoderma asperellum CBS 433.97]PTB41639.1 hypothetical protein M441DRAFT_36946 [Trichoderma asperellum CBS 433.97]UKZ94898.1 hypothetical protein TrAFT101_009753 [Trichoderma asperellum]
MHFYHLAFSALAGQALAAPSAAASATPTPQNWLYSPQIDDVALNLLDRHDIVGVQAQYTWKSLEPTEGYYNFSKITRDYKNVLGKGKKLWVQVQDRTFDPSNDPVPGYLHTPYYNNGSAPSCDGNCTSENFNVTGYVAQQWNARVRSRYQALLKELAHDFDGKITGLNLPETSITVDVTANNYTDEGYFLGELENAGYAASVFKKSYAVQYVNFWPDGWNNTNNRFTDSFNYYAKHGVGVGGPDLIPNKPGQMKNSYVYIPEYHNKVPITVIAVQQPDVLNETNAATGKPFTKEEFVDFAVNDLKIDIIFWTTIIPWLQGK